MSISLKFCCIFIIFVICSTLLRVESFTPKERLAHSSVLVGDKLYFFGGAGSDSIWKSMGNCSINNDPNIYLFGGYMVDNDLSDSFTSIIYRFNVNYSTWSIPPVGGISPERRRLLIVMEIHQQQNTLIIWSFLMPLDYHGQLFLRLTHRDNETSYTATLLPNGFIVYIGGYEIKENGDYIVVDIKQTNLYDTNSLTWSLKTAGFTSQIQSRLGHTAVIAPNGKIIIYGGSKRIGNIKLSRVFPDISDVGTVPSIIMISLGII
ncbi:18362_t:CDS:2 [Funneliformis geosporum]|uniref:18362_t:CDS:1 n=1 Tax=Funneliformis geosporum TaxID=1117311 RepID=A0A9W4SSI6_9GLOM|nr:18362_t:CDS:2 [Funneliformis geosporum]